MPDSGPCPLDIDAKLFRCHEDHVLKGIPAAVYAFHREDARRRRSRAMGDAALGFLRRLRRLFRFTLALAARIAR